MRWGSTLLLIAVALVGCDGEDGVPGGQPGDSSGGGGTGGSVVGPGGGGDVVPGGREVTSCGFTYDEEFLQEDPPAAPGTDSPLPWPLSDGPDSIVHAEPDPPFTFRAHAPWRKVPPEDLVLPGYEDNMPTFPRGVDWGGAVRCYETPSGARLLSEAEAYDTYRVIAERTTGVAMNVAPEVRTVVGLRGAYPGELEWHGNLPDRFDDTLALLWTEADGSKHVREFPVNTDTGAYEFGYHNSSSLRANRRYRYVNGWHKTYNALHIDEYGYRVRDDANKNGHWDSDRNGWLPPDGADDHDRTGGGHNIHMGSRDGPLGSATIGVWSAGCQVIPGMANWMEFITNAWTEMGSSVDYFLIDVRDIAPEVWEPCAPDGTRTCPYRIDAFPFGDTRDTAAEGQSELQGYSCSAADESGPEVVYVFTVVEQATLRVEVDCGDGVDVDVHLLDGAEATACLARDDRSIQYDIAPGRYWLVADSYVKDGSVLAGAYSLQVTLD